MKGLIRAAASRPVATAMVWLGILLFGGLAMTEIPLDYLPDISYPRVVVTTSYPGMPAEEVRTLVSLPLEDAFASVKGIKDIESISREGRSVISLDFHWGEDALSASIRAREAIDAAYTGLPDGCEKPVAFPSDPGAAPVITVSLKPSGADLSLTRKLAETDVRTRLQQAAGVGAVTIVGGTETEFRVVVSQDKAAAKGVTASDVARFLGRENFDYPVGSIRSGDSEIVIKTKGRVASAQDLYALRMPMENGSFELSQIATIEETDKDRESAFVQDGDDCVGLEVFRRKGANPVEVARAVRLEAGRIAEAYGRDFTVSIASDSSTAIVASIRNLAISAISGAFITFLVLLLVTRDPKGSALLVITIPVSITVGVAALRLMGRTLNTMSLGGIALGIGMIVDNSIVVLDVLRRLPSAARKDPAAVTRQVESVFVSIMASTITSLIVFLPVVFLPGIIGALFTDLALSVIFTQFGGFLTAITLVPVAFMAFTWKDGEGSKDPMEKVRGMYVRALAACFKKPAISVSVVAVAFLAGALALPALSYEFMPVDDAAVVEAVVLFPYGRRIESVVADAVSIEKALLADGRFPTVSARAGGEKDDALYQSDPDSRPERLTLRVSLDRSALRAADASAAIRSIVMALGYDCEARPPKDPVETILGVGRSVISWAAGGKDPAEAKARGELALAEAERDASDYCLSIGLSPAGMRDEIRISPDRESLATSSMGFYDAAGALHAAVEGELASRLVVDSREKDIRVSLTGGGRPSPELGSVIVRASGPIRVADVADVSMERSVPLYLRVNREDVVLLELVPKAGGRDGAAAAMEAVAKGKPWLRSADASVLVEYGGRLALTLAIVVALLYLTLGAQFESFSLPLLLLVTIPLSFSGIAIALLVTGTTVNFGSALGVIVLFGVAVNNSIVLYEVTAQKASEAGLGGRCPAERAALAIGAASAGAAERLGPILSTVMTTVIAIFPILLSPSGASQKAMSVAIIGGLVVSTALTLFTAPLVFARRAAGKSRAA